MATNNFIISYNVPYINGSYYIKSDSTISTFTGTKNIEYALRMSLYEVRIVIEAIKRKNLDCNFSIKYVRPL